MRGAFNGDVLAVSRERYQFGLQRRKFGGVMILFAYADDEQRQIAQAAGIVNLLARIITPSDETIRAELPDDCAPILAT